MSARFICRPLSSNPFDTSPTFQEIMAYWQVDATIVVNFNMHSTGIGKAFISLPKIIMCVKVYRMM